MRIMRALPVFTALVCLVLSSASSVAQDPGQGGSPPPRIQGPSGGPLAAPPAGDPNGAAPVPLKFKMYALMGQKKTSAAATLDETIKPIEAALKELPYTDYKKITVDERDAPEGVDTQFPINPVYSLVVRPNGKDAQGASKLDIHVDLMQDGKLIKALTAQAAAKPGDALLLRGMPLPPGELVIVLQRDAGDQQSQGGQSDQDQQKQDNQQQQKSDQDKESKKDDAEKKLEESKKDEKTQDDKKDKKQGKDDKKEEKDQDKQEQAQEQPSSEDEKKDSADKKDTKNLESILQSLEDVDRKEQAEVRNKRDRIDFKGDWW